MTPAKKTIDVADGDPATAVRPRLKNTICEVMAAKCGSVGAKTLARSVNEHTGTGVCAKVQILYVIV